MTTYNYGVPGVVIWLLHILMGLWFLYAGRMVLNNGNLKALESVTLKNLLFLVGAEKERL